MQPIARPSFAGRAAFSAGGHGTLGAAVWLTRYRRFSLKDGLRLRPSPVPQAVRRADLCCRMLLGSR